MIDYKNISDLELVHHLKSDDHKAFDEILKRYTPLLLRVAYRKVYDIDLAQDLFHDVMTDLWAKRQQYTFYTSFQAFILTAMRNRILNHFNREKITGRYLEHFKASFSEETDTTDYQARYNDLKAWIEREIAALPEKQREVFELSRNTDMTRKEIAEHLGRPENTVKDQMQGALRILKSKLGNSFHCLFL